MAGMVFTHSLSDVMQQNPGGTKGFTISDLLAHLDEIAAQQQQQQQGSPVEASVPMESKTPRRSQSLANCMWTALKVFLYFGQLFQFLQMKFSFISSRIVF
jgi:hypothetical protein